MEKEFDFSAFAKSNPYNVPDGFFENLPEQTLLLAKKRASSHKRIAMVTVVSISVAASVALFVAWPFIANPKYPSNDPMAYQGGQAPVAVVVDTAKAVKPVTTPDTLKVTQPTVPVKKVVKQPTATSEPVVSKKESLDDLLAELSLEELMQMADNGDDDHFIND